jgi:cytochrome c2
MKQPFSILTVGFFAITGALAQTGLHPLFTLEDVYPSNDVELKVTSMAFSGNDLYVTVASPDRTNVKPFKEGEVFKVTGLIGNSDRSKIKAKRLFGELYEPTAITVFNGKIYVGEKDKISRWEDTDGNGKYEQNEKTILFDGISQPNFHTYTIGFEQLQHGGTTYLAGNLTTSILLGGKRDLNITVNPKTHRGSTFVFGPITGEETAADCDIQYLAGGYRTPNGIGLGKDQAVIVTDNQGIFNPANKFIRVTPGAFYGHYLLKKDDTNISAFQPKDVESEKGGSEHQTPATVYLQQGSVARSPSQPIMLRNLTGEAAAYNGQFLVGDLTAGRMNRVFIEEVDGIWQGAAFLHSSGYDEKGVTGFTAGPNRIVEGPDHNFYLGHIGAGGLWQFRGAPGNPWWGLQRLSPKKQLPSDFNEMLAVRDIENGLEIEFFRPVPQEQLTATNFDSKQWTYIPTNGYGGPDIGTESLKVTAVEIVESGKKVRLTIPGIRSNQPPFIEKNGYTNKNVGWVVQIDFKGSKMWQNSAWYTVQKHRGSAANQPIVSTESSDPMVVAETLHQSICMACHSSDGTKILGPSFKGMLGRKQTVVRDGKELEVTIDEAYLDKAMQDPLYEYPKDYIPAMPNLELDEAQRSALIQWIKTLK